MAASVDRDRVEDIIEVGADFGLVHAGMETLESTRTEAGQLDYGLDIENSDSPLEAGLGLAVDFDKPGKFVGREALLKQRETRPYTFRLVQFLLQDPEPLLYGEEPVFSTAFRSDISDRAHTVTRWAVPWTSGMWNTMPGQLPTS